MPHLDPEQLSLLALYDDWQDEDSREHLRSCSECASDYAALRRTVEAVKTTPDTRSLTSPGPHVWAGIHRELGLSPSLTKDPLTAARGQDQRGQDQREEQERTGRAEESPPAGEQARSDVARRRTAAWWQRPGTWLAAAAATLVVASVTLWTLNQTPEPLAQAELAPLAQHSHRFGEGGQGVGRLPHPGSEAQRGRGTGLPGSLADSPRPFPAGQPGRHEYGLGCFPGSCGPGALGVPHRGRLRRARGWKPGTLKRQHRQGHAQFVRHAPSPVPRPLLCSAGWLCPVG